MYKCNAVELLPGLMVIFATLLAFPSKITCENAEKCDT